MLILSPLSPNGYEFSSNSNLRNLSLAVISSSEAPPLVIQARSLYITCSACSGVIGFNASSASMSHSTTRTSSGSLGTNCGSTYIQPHCPAALMSICSTVFSSLKYAICYYIFVSNCNILIYRPVEQCLQTSSVHCKGAILFSIQRMKFDSMI